MEKVEICRKLISGSCAGCPNVDLIKPAMVRNSGLTLAEAMRKISLRNCPSQTTMQLPTISNLSALGRGR